MIENKDLINSSCDLADIQEENLKIIQKSIEDFSVDKKNSSEEKIEASIPINNVASKESTVENKNIISKNTSSATKDESELKHEEETLKLEVQEKNKAEIELEEVKIVEVDEKEEENGLKDLDEKLLVSSLEKNILFRFLAFVKFGIKYTFTAGFIFVFLMLTTNYSAYITIAKSYLNPDEITLSEQNVVKTIEASKIKSATKKTSNIDNNENITKIDNESNKGKISMNNIIGGIKNESLDLDIEIIPFTNRILIPKIGKNIPLVEVDDGGVKDMKELNDIFMEELRFGVVRYPGSAKPGSYGNSFIFGHSSNFPWVKGDYNDVFVLLDRLEVGDEMISYYEGQKYVYKIKEKKVINPKDVSILKRDEGLKELTLMTCWPIGTTYNRLIVIGELVN